MTGDFTNAHKRTEHSVNVSRSTMAWSLSPIVLSSAVAVAVPALYVLRRYLRERLVFNSTIIPELAAVGSGAVRKHGTVVICGARCAKGYAGSAQS
jgi:hypothetical protein